MGEVLHQMPAIILEASHRPCQPFILSVNLFRIGIVFIYVVLSESTSTSDRRLKHDVKSAVKNYVLGNRNTVAVSSGLANGSAVNVYKIVSTRIILYIPKKLKIYGILYFNNAW
ncbi:hypothetical protein K501DRAFT_278608 [Backusella circina FSU 941]|nr:hypothetical protein K501DRAFT_278608 [Backusella circina FSU 941]